MVTDRWMWNLNEYGMCLINDVPVVSMAAVPVSQFASMYCTAEILEGKLINVPYIQKFSWYEIFTVSVDDRSVVKI